jgi:predicted Mrr-cat superfamily restriction endonuclease
MEQTKLTEDQTIKILMKYLVQDNWKIESYCLGQQRGYDIIASKNLEKMFVEVKGAKASDASPTKKRKYFDSGQIKDHFGKAIVKSFETLNDNPKAIVAIAHPDDKQIRNSIGHNIKHINKLGIIHFWVGTDNVVFREE